MAHSLYRLTPNLLHAWGDRLLAMGLFEPDQVRVTQRGVHLHALRVDYLHVDALNADDTTVIISGCDRIDSEAVKSYSFPSL